MSRAYMKASEHKSRPAKTAGSKRGNLDTHPHRRASSLSTGPPHAILRRRQNAHATVVPRLYAFFAVGSCRPVGPPPTGIRRAVVGEYITIRVASWLRTAWVGYAACAMCVYTCFDSSPSDGVPGGVGVRLCMYARP